MMRLALFCFCIPVALWAAEPKRPLDRSKPVRVETLYEMVSRGGEVVGKVLLSSRLTLDPSVRREAFSRILFEFSDGDRVAVYSQLDAHRSPAVLRWLLVDVKPSEYVLLQAELPFVEQEGWVGVEKASGQQKSFVSFETPRLRVHREEEQTFGATNLPDVFQKAEPELLQRIQELRRRLGAAGGESGWAQIRERIDTLAGLLKLPDVPAGDLELKLVKRGLAPDLPEAPAAPLAPEFEDAFGKWASWGELPQMRK
ncbi:MAG: hypothetical protein ACK42L_04070 [Thermoanaerobaculum sp.]